MFGAENKVIVITGGSAGLGRALALEAGRRKGRVAVLARRRDNLNQVRSQIIEAGGEAVAIATDIGDQKAVRLAFAEIESRWSRIDILFNVAGVVEPIKPLVKIDDAEMMLSLMVNVLGVYTASREAVKIMQGQLSGGTIINITSGAATAAYIGWSMYGSQKAAVDQFTRIVAEELKAMPIRIAALSPGPFESHMQQVMRSVDKSDFPMKDKFVKLHESGALPTPEQIAPMLLDIALTDWPELNGMVARIRDDAFLNHCRNHGIMINISQK